MAMLAPRANLEPMLDIVAWIIGPELGRPGQFNPFVIMNSPSTTQQATRLLTEELVRRGTANYRPLVIINVIIHVTYHDPTLPKHL